VTVELPSSGSSVVPYDPEAFGDVGLEDVGATDVVIPRLRIVHAEGVFEDNLSKQKFDKLTVVLLGLVKQRMMWHSDVEDDDKPQCKSPDFEHGFPTMNPERVKRRENLFPWDKSNFEPEQFPPGGPTSINGLVTLPCSSCIFQQWDKGDWKTPPCAEQHTYPLLYTPDEGDSWTPALLSLQKTGIKPSRQYLSSFAASKQPMFTVFTELSLTLQSRGQVKYSTPNLKRLGQTEREMWGEYADRYRAIREFVRTPPRPEEDDDATAVDPTPASTAAAPASVASSPSSTAPAVPAATSASPAPDASASAPAAPAPEQPSAAASPASSPASADDDLPF
jgi:hypothetical protein